MKQKNLFFDAIPRDPQVGDDPVEQLLLREYGSVFIARGGAVPPPVIIFHAETEVKRFQASVESATETIGGFPMTLQASAMSALLSAIRAASTAGKQIMPRGPDSAARSYGHTVELWHSRVEPALGHWTSLWRIFPSEAERIRSLSPFEQVPVVLKLEEDGIYFAKDFSKSIIYSVAPPGTSQHLAMLAFDVAEFADPEIRQILSEFGWFQTVSSDLPHFTFLGAAENELPSLGLKKVQNSGQTFWVPDI